jgi:hypothetical protein
MRRGQRPFRHAWWRNRHRGVRRDTPELTEHAVGLIRCQYMLVRVLYKCETPDQQAHHQ